MSQEMESSSQVADIVNQLDEQLSSNNTYTSTNGVVFRLKKVSRLLILDATKKIPPPAVPVVFIEEKGRSEENPSDPTYLEKMQEYNTERSLLTSTLIIGLGTEVDKLPPDLTDFNDAEWAEDLAEFGITVPIKGKARYASWVKYHLLTNDEDYAELVKAVLRFSGTTIEEDVSKAAESFRSN